MNVFAYASAAHDDGDRWTHAWIVEGVEDPDAAVQLIEEQHASHIGSGAPGGPFHDAPFLAAYDPERRRAVVYQRGGFDI